MGDAANPRTAHARLAAMVQRADVGDPRYNWPLAYAKDIRWCLTEMGEYQRELAEIVDAQVELVGRQAMGDMALPEKVPFRRVQPEHFEWPDGPLRDWGMASKLWIAGLRCQVKGGVRFPNERVGVVLATGPRLDTMFTVPVEWFDRLVEMENEDAEDDEDGEDGGGDVVAEDRRP